MPKYGTRTAPETFETKMFQNETFYVVYDIVSISVTVATEQVTN